MANSITGNGPDDPVDLTEVSESKPANPNSLTKSTASDPANPNSLTKGAASDPSNPASLTKTTASDPANPSSLTKGAASDPANPNSLTKAAASDPTNPNTLTKAAASDPANPVSTTKVTASDPANPASLTKSSASAPANPVNLTKTADSGILRTLTPTLDLDFGGNQYAQLGNTKSFGDIVTYSRASSATFINRRIDSLGRYETFLDTDYVGNVENLLTYSEQFDNADWSKTRSSIANSNLKNANGMPKAERLIEDNTSSDTHFTQSAIVTTTSNAIITASVYAKAQERSQIAIQTVQGVTGEVVFDLQSGSILSASGTGDPIGSIKYICDGWYLCAVTVANSGTSARLRVSLASNGSVSYSGDGESGVLIDRAQLTESAKPLPYVKTLSTAVTETFTESPRLEYDPTTKQPKGAFIEGSSTNLQVYSEEFDNAAWNKGSASITTNDVIAPDLTKSADKLEAGSTATIIPNINDAVTSTASSQYTTSCYVKAGEERYIQIFYGTGDVTGNPRVNFDLVAGTVGSQDSGIDNANITYVRDGWYRIESTITAATTAVQSYLAIIKSSTDSRSATNSFTAGDGLYIWGAQVEAKPFATSYIRTEGATVSRSADSLSRSSVGVFNSREYTIKATINTNQDMQASASIVSVTGGSERTQIDINSGKLRPFILSSGGSGSFLGSSISLGSDIEVALIYESGVASGYLNRSLDGSFGIEPMKEEDTLIIGALTATAQRYFGNIKRLTIYDKALTEAEVSKL